MNAKGKKLGNRNSEIGNRKSEIGNRNSEGGIAGTRAKEAQTVRIDGFRQPVGFKRAAEVLEVIPSGLGGNEGARDVAAGVVIDGE